MILVPCVKCGGPPAFAWYENNLRRAYDYVIGCRCGNEVEIEGTYRDTRASCESRVEALWNEENKALPPPEPPEPLDDKTRHDLWPTYPRPRAKLYIGI